MAENKDKNEKKKEPIDFPDGGFAFKPKPERKSVPPKKNEPENKIPEKKEEPKEEEKEPSLEDRVKWALGEETEDVPVKKEYGVETKKEPSQAKEPSDRKPAPEMPESPQKNIDPLSLKMKPKKSIPPAFKEPIPEPMPVIPDEVEGSHEPETVYAPETEQPKLQMTKVFFPIVAAISVILLVLLIVSAVWNISLKKYTTELKAKALSNAEIAKKLVTEKSKITDEFKLFKKKADTLTEKTASTEEVSSRMEKQIDILTTELAASKSKLPEMREKMKEYANEVETIVSGKVEYYKAYMEEKENREQLDLVVDGMAEEIDTLSENLASVDEKYLEKECKYVYEIAFLNVRSEMYEEAIQNFEKYLDLHGDDADVYYNLAILYERIRHDKAKTIYCYRKYLELDPTADDLYEVTIRIDSLKRIGTKKPTSFKNLKINLNDLKY
ncbi:MAG: hypothetical protein ISS33_06780 [Candidatus Omnitrophica bacterium]|nr:hypothetical protein [Candidatus Omnitrophota bacterium]